eukprot:COSAG02_NODE_785_length_17228_cov_24.082141_9_plen_84_part_00
MAGSRPTAWVGQFPLAWERERVVVSFRVLPNVRHVKGNLPHATVARAEPCLLGRRDQLTVPPRMPRRARAALTHALLRRAGTA